MARSIPALLAATLWLLACATASAENGSPVLGRIVNGGTLRVGMSGNQPPLNFRNKSGEMRGLEVDLARALAAAMGVELQIVTKPFGELLGTLAKGEVDMVMSGMSITPERNLKVAFVGPYFVSGKSILTKSSVLAAADETADIDDLELKIAALEGSTSQLFVEKVLPKAKLTTTKDYDEAVKLVVEDKVQAMVADFEICALQTLLQPRSGLTALRQPLTIEPIGIAVPPGDALLVNFLQNYLGALQGTQALDLLQARWLQQGDWVGDLP
jgi:ABC-type amino acid transport substrate-binding protein